MPRRGVAAQIAERAAPAGPRRYQFDAVYG